MPMDIKNAVVTTLPKNSRQNTRKSFARIPKKWKNQAFSKQIYFFSRCSSEHAQWIFGKPAVTLLPRVRKTFHKSKNVEVTIFWSEFFFIENYSLTTDNAILTTLPKIFSEKPQICRSLSKKWRKNIWIFRKKNVFPQIVLMYV